MPPCQRLTVMEEAAARRRTEIEAGGREVVEDQVGGDRQARRSPRTSFHESVTSHQKRKAPITTTALRTISQGCTTFTIIRQSPKASCTFEPGASRNLYKVAQSEFSMAGARWSGCFKNLRTS
jgi:hypothetical protein